MLSAGWSYVLESSGFLKIDKKFEKLADFKVDHSKKLLNFQNRDFCIGNPIVNLKDSEDYRYA